MSYTPPSNVQLNFRFFNTGGFTAPTNAQLTFAFGVPPGTLAPVGVDTSSYGGATIANLNQYATPAGWDSLAFGGALVSSPYLFPSGWSGSAFGSATIINRDRFIVTTNFSSLVFGTADIFNRISNLAPGGIRDDHFGTAFAAGGIRPVYGIGFDGALFGAQTVSLGTRQIYPLWWIDTRWGYGEAGQSRDVAPAGLDALLFGATIVRDNRQFPAPVGWDSAVFGLGSRASYGKQFAGAYTIEPVDFDHWTPPHIHNVRQLIMPVYALGRWIEGGFGSELVMSVRNVNRVVDLVGNGIPPFFRGVSQNATVRNNARILRPAGQDSLIFGSGSFIAYRDRDVAPFGWLSYKSDRFTVVYNAAAQVLAAGFASALFGNAAVVNTRRYYDHVTLGAQGAVGTPFIAPRVRTLNQDGSYLNPVGGLLGGARVSYRVRDLTPIAPPFGYGGFFGPIIVTGYPPRTIAPHGMPPINAVGNAHVSNVTPQLYPYWNSSQFTQWGRPNVHNQHEAYQFQGFNPQAFGLHFIDYRTKKLRPFGLDAFRPNNFHAVRNVDPDPPSRQYINPPPVDTGSVVANPAVHANSLYPSSIGNLLFGTASVRSNNLLPQGMPAYADPTSGNQVGTPSINGPTYVDAVGIGQTEAFGKPDFHPRTIWAPSGAPAQAKINHPPGNEEVIDLELDPVHTERPVFGDVRIDLKNRRIQATSLTSQDTYGFPSLSIRPIYAGVLGFKGTKYGIPIINGGGALGHYNLGPDDVYGETTVIGQIPNPWYFSSNPIDALLFGQPIVANFNRDVAPASMLGTFGSTVVQRPPPPAEPAGLDATIFGAGTFIDYRIRHVIPEGDEFFVMDYELGHFADRMRVKGSKTASFSLGDQLHIGTPSIEHTDRTVHPGPLLPLDGGALGQPRIKFQNRVNVDAWTDVGDFGDTWALPVTPGEIQPRGEFETLFGDGLRLNQQIYPLGWLDNAIFAGPLHLEHEYDAMGQARGFGGGLIPTMGIANAVGAQGLDAAQFGLAALIGTGCGTQVRALVGFDALALGSPGVAHG